MKNFFILLTSAMMATEVAAHGGLTKPAARNVMWKRGFPSAPKNYDWPGLAAGGPAQVFTGPDLLNHGTCGDAASLATPRPHEHGGKYGNGVLAAHYPPGSVIPVTVEITAHHEGPVMILQRTFCRLKAPCCTAMDWIFILAYCFAIP